ncbi:hypothetical protein M011DRAFT_463934 [Sporormia fimetaria CBS 119925]|uniref:DNA helicase n=1 Tax=Sporormia fimetaria CBS 119925 TaxID=1340428 RepID=A0A6A6VN82_9PLEO|nr:hypothetical protein M011DRAFT_463934 [Sporormia fimetaria CBS 119925]
MGADVETVHGDNVDPPSDVVPDVKGVDETASRPHRTPEAEVDADSPVKLEGDEDPLVRNGDDEAASSQRPAKRRRLDDGTPRRSASRAASPPWKSFVADGPTTIISDDGTRRSARVSKETSASLPPPSLPPPKKGGGRGTPRNNNPKAATPKVKAAGSAKKGAAAAQSSPPSRKSERQRKPSAAAAAATTARDPPARLNASPTASRTRTGRPRRSTQHYADDADDDDFASSSYPSNQSTTSRTRLRWRTADPLNRHPRHAPPPRKFESFSDWLRHDDPLEGEENQRITDEKAREEAERRLRIVDAVEHGVLSEAQCSVYLPDPAEEPPPQYGHWDHVVAHAIHFGKLMKEEKLRHRRNAKLLARDAFEYWKQKYKRKTEEEIAQEEADRAVTRYKQLVKDVKETWANVKVEIDQERIAKWEEEQLQLGHKAMDNMFHQAQEILGRGPADSASLVSDDSDSEGDGFGSDASDDENLDEIMSSSGDSDSEPAIDDDDANLTAEQLRAKYGQLPDLPVESSDESDGDHGEEGSGDERTPEPTPDPDEEMEDAGTLTNGRVTSDTGQEEDESRLQTFDPANVELEEVDAALLDSDEEGGASSGSEAWDSDEDEESEEGEEAESGSEGGDDVGVMGFLSQDEIKQLKEAAKPVPGDSESAIEAEQEHLAADKQAPQQGAEQEPEIQVAEHGGEEPAKTNGHSTNRQEEIEDEPKDAEDVAMASPSVEEVAPDPAEDSMSVKPVSRSRSRHTSSPPRTEVPSLLRGTLREYQHGGLDWLANLYDTETNGILADEMGLGKTIQTISLLAWVALNRGVWGPHLVVVPTSVMLNWEMEFKKWCPGFKILTYYGDIAERKRKRTGWRTMGRDMWNVVITSYQLIIQDAAAFKQRHWQYLILDEAHNIKNFKSQRWQTMLTLRTERRLLLTGTPLQNNIDELWSLLYFLMPAGFAGEGRIAGLEEFTMALKNPTSQILEQGRQQLDAEAQKIVKKLHEVLRPYLLRRLKADVEKQMPAKYEHVVYCKLSKRQRQLYDGFMGRASTKQILSSGNYMSIINCLMSLRKVCNHPDLFETRAIVTSMAMPKSVPAEYEIKDFLIRKRLHEQEEEEVNLDALNLLFARREQTSLLHARRAQQIRATRPLEDLIARQTRRLNAPPAPGTSTVQAALASMERNAGRTVLARLQTCLRLTESRTQFLPIYGQSLIERLTMSYEDYAFGAHEQAPPREDYRFQSKPYGHSGMQPGQYYPHNTQGRPYNPYQYGGEPKPFKPKRGIYGFRSPRTQRLARDWNMNQIQLFYTLIPTLEERAETFDPLITRFTCVTPAVFAEELAPLTVSPAAVSLIRSSPLTTTRDPFHEPRIRQSIAFPDKRLLQYDCGKLQRLAVLLRHLQSGGHRALIFTQMTKVLDILEQFLNIHGHRYLRLDGATKVEQRQILTDRFNSDPRILCFILSSRSGGLGINLTGADTVIFYDLDWNPAMDKQCQDRSHRIGQTRDVHIYKFVSEYTIEANILRKSNQKRLLDDVIIQKGDFTTDYFQKMNWRDALAEEQEMEERDEAGDAMDRVLTEKVGLLGDASVMTRVEDVEDRNAVGVALKELRDEVKGDQGDFVEGGSGSGTPALGTRNVSEGPGKETEAEEENAGVKEKRHVDEYMLDWFREEWGKEPYKPPTERQRKRAKKGQDVHRVRKKRVY